MEELARGAEGGGRLNREHLQAFHIALHNASRIFT
jgi:hypothetical protein